MIKKTTQKPLEPNARFETCVDHCGQSLFEVWLPVDALDEFEAWFDEDLRRIEAKFASFSTPNSYKQRKR